MAFGPWGNEEFSSTNFSGAWITDPEDHASTVIEVRYGGVGRERSKDRAKTAMQYIGRSFPVYEVGEARAESVNVETMFPSEDDDTPQQIARMERIVGESRIVLYRDSRGRKMYAMPTDFRIKDEEMGGYTVSFLLNRVDFDEELPTIPEVIANPVDTQVKNFTVTVDTASSTVLLDWDDIPGATLYTVFLDGVPVIQTETSLGSYGPMVPGTYSMWCRAVVSSVEGLPSTTVAFNIEDQGTTPDPGTGGGGTTPPVTTVPQNFRAFPQSNKSVNFTWDAVPGATQYRMKEVRSPNGVTNGIYTGTSATRGSPVPLGDGPFDYWLEAMVNGVWSAASNHQQFTLPYDGSPIGGGGGTGGGSGSGGTVGNPVQVLGLGVNDGQLHYNLGMGFRPSDGGHINIQPAELYAWDTTTGNVKKLVDGGWVFSKVDVDGNIVVSLEAPRDGSPTTSNTSYARCEFREQDESGIGNISFNPTSGLHYQEGYSRIVSLAPLKPGVCFNQAHDADDDTMMLKTKKSGSKIVVVLDILGTEQMVVDSDYQVGQLIWSRLEVDNGFGRVYYKKGGGKTSTTVWSGTLSGIKTTGWYFKFGSYNQSNSSTDSTGRIITEVFGWKHWHTGWPTPTDSSGALPQVNAGADATVAPGGTFSRTGAAVGTGITARGWRLVGAGTANDPGTAAYTQNWGSPMPDGDEFNYSGPPDPNKWGLYDGPGHANNGLRVPARCFVSNGTLKIQGLAGSANAGGMSHNTQRQYGKWEIRARSYSTNSPTQQPTPNPSYHPVAIIWSDNQPWPKNGEYDFLENDRVGEASAGQFIHYPSKSTTNYQESPTNYPVDQRQFHNYAIEWTATGIKTYVDGVLWSSYSGTGDPGSSKVKDIQAMDAGGHLTLQMDAFTGSGLNAGTFEIEWVRMYPVVPVNTNPGLSTTDSLNYTVPSTPGTYTLEYFATNSQGTATDQVVLTVATGGGGGTTPGNLVYAETFPDGTPYDTFGPGQTVINVSGSAALTSALASATPGQIITLASGTYTGNFTLSGKNGTASSGIVIRSASALGAVFGAGSTFVINNCKHVTVEGLDLPYDTTGQTFTISGNSDHVRVTRCRFGPNAFANSANVGLYMYVGDDVSHFRIDHCTLRNKGTSGNMIRVYGNFDTYVGCKYGRIDHNLFDTFGDEVGNDKETIRYGVSTMSRTIANSVIERNVFVNIKTEPEVISGKMASVWQRGNTILRCTGGIVIRHGRNCLQASNYVVDRVNSTGTAGTKSGGSRFYDSGHIIEDNYYDGLASTSGFQRALILDTGDAGGTSTNLAGHWNVVNAQVRRNVIINSTGGIYIGSNYSTAPDSSGIVDNDVVNSGGAAVTTVKEMTGDSVVSNNQYFATAAAGAYTADTAGIYRKAGRGPKVKYLTPTDVGTTGDLLDADKTGAAV